MPSGRLILLLALSPLLLGAGKPGPPPLDPEAEYGQRAARLGETDPKGWVALADFCEERGLWERQAEALRKVLALEPDHKEARARLDEACFSGEWLPAEEAEAREAEAMQGMGLLLYGTTWIPAKEADRLREADRKAVRWDVETRIDTPHLVLYSSRPLAFTRRLAALLENEVGAYRRLYGRVWKMDPGAKPIRIYLFGDRATFERVGGPVHGGHLSDYVGGFYDANATKILYVGMIRGAEGNETMAASIAVHELLHGLDYLLSRSVVKGTPKWIQEGRAEHFGQAIQGRRVQPGTLSRFARGRFRTVFGGGMPEIPIATLVDGACGFTEAHYAASQAFVHFLFHGDGGRHAAGFRAFLSGLPAKASRAEFEKAVGKLPALEPAFRRHDQEVLLAS